MKKKFQLTIITLQGAISLIYILSVLYILIDNLRFNTNLYFNNQNFFSIVIQLITFFALAIQIYQMNEPQRNSSTSLLLLVLLMLSLDGIVLLPDLFKALKITIISPIIIGKLHIFSIIYSTLLLILCGINQNERNTKNTNNQIVFTFAIAFILTYVININSPTINNPYYMLDTSIQFKIFFIILMLLAILSFVPSYLTDKTKHNKLKTYSYIFFTISLACLKSSNNINLIIQIFALLLLISSSVILTINLKSYSI